MSKKRHTNLDTLLESLAEDERANDDLDHRYLLRRALLNSRYFDKRQTSFDFTRFFKATTPALFLSMFIFFFLVQAPTDANPNMSTEAAQKTYPRFVMSPAHMSYDESTLYVYGVDDQLQVVGAASHTETQPEIIPFEFESFPSMDYRFAQPALMNIQ